MSVTIEANRARQDEATESYHQCWFPVALASDVPAGAGFPRHARRHLS
jgi:hypothetical protein